jgi:hypothetical protein
LKLLTITTEPTEKRKREKFEKRGRRLDTVKRAWQTNPQGAFE